MKVYLTDSIMSLENEYWSVYIGEIFDLFPCIAYTIMEHHYARDDNNKVYCYSNIWHYSDDLDSICIIYINMYDIHQ